MTLAQYLPLCEKADYVCYTKSSIEMLVVKKKDNEICLTTSWDGDYIEDMKMVNEDNWQYKIADVKKYIEDFICLNS